MSEENASGVKSASGEGVESTDSDSVSYESYRKAVDQHKRSKTRALEMQQELEAMREQLDKYQARDREAEQRVLEEKGQYDKILQSYKSEIEKLTGQIEGEKQERLNRAKKDAFLSQLPGPLHNSDYINLARLSDIAVDTETGEVDPITLKEAVDGFVTQHPALIKLKSEEKAATSDRERAAPRPVDLNHLNNNKPLSAKEKFMQLRKHEEGL